MASVAPSRTKTRIHRRTPQKSALATAHAPATKVVYEPRPALCRGHHYWMVATLMAFPAGMAIAIRSGYGAVWTFVGGALASLLVLLLNILIEEEFWMFEHPWRKHLEDPEFSHRFLILTGGMLLIIQTLLLLFLLSGYAPQWIAQLTRG